MSAGISTPTIRRLQAQKASAERWPNPNKEQIARDYAAEKLAEYVRRTLATAPELTDEQVDRLSRLLRGGEGPEPPGSARTPAPPAGNWNGGPDSEPPGRGEDLSIRREHESRDSDSATPSTAGGDAA